MRVHSPTWIPQTALACFSTGTVETRTVQKVHLRCNIICNDDKSRFNKMLFNNANETHCHEC
jgi:hypothetical protein